MKGQTILSAPFEVVTPSEPAEPALSLSWAGPNPGQELSLRLSLPDDRPSRLRVFDLQGRVVDSREVGALGPGEHVIKVQDRIRSGVYVVRLSQGGRVSLAKAVVMR